MELLKSKKEVSVSLSSTEVEYRSIRKFCIELAWLSRLFGELNVPNITLVPLKCDNMQSIYIASNHVFLEMTITLELVSFAFNPFI